jgi:hypothetical protein
VGKEFAKGVYCSAVLEVTNESDVETVHCTKLLSDGKDVKKGLGGVLAAAVTSVDDGHI